MTPSTVQNTYKKALNLINKNQFFDAEKLLKQFITMNGGDLNCERLLGIAYQRQQKYSDAINVFKSIHSRVKGTHIAVKDLVTAYIAAGENAQGISLLKKLATKEASSVPLWFLLGDCYVEDNKLNEASNAYSIACKLDPLRNKIDEAKVALQQHNSALAAQIYQQIVGINPQNVEAKTGLAIHAMESGNYDQSRKIFSEILQITRYWPLALTASGDLSMRTGQYESAKQSFELSLKLDPKNHITWAMYGIALDFLFQHEESIEALSKSLKILPNQPEIFMVLGNIYRVQGDTSQSIKCYKKYIKSAPFNGAAYWALADLKTYTFSTKDIETLERASKNANCPPTHFSQIHFALAQAHEQNGEFDQAFNYYSKGNAIQRSVVHYDTNETVKSTDAIINGYSKELLSRGREQTTTNQAPIFILGLPRTGSTLVEQILASHSEVDATMELPFIGNFVNDLTQQLVQLGGYPNAINKLSPANFETLTHKYLKSAETYRAKAARFIDKMPNNFRHIGLIHLMFPDAKIIDVRRHPMDTCLSLFKHHFSIKQPFSYDLIELGHYYQLYLKLMDHWHSVLPKKIYTLHYEDLVNHPEEEIGKLLNYCDLPFEDNCLSPHKTKRNIRTASSEQVRQPITKANLAHWRNFETHLSSLKTALGKAFYE